MKKMLIDATNANETRLAIVNNNTLENYEFEPKPSQYTKGNVYLAKVVRVEPALQAAFVEYADDRQGFLPFSEIHPDYYRIPVEDYEALMAEQRERLHQAMAREQEDVTAEEDEASTEEDQSLRNRDALEGDKALIAETAAEIDAPASLTFTPQIVRRYKIQEVIKRGQLMLVQVTKEERGNKRAALSTYIALAGCYCVLIPNALFNGGVSRKIESVKERKRLKKLMSALDVPEGMALILRTAAEGRTKASIARDLKYLLQLWDEMRQKTLDSVAPLLIHAEADLVNRSLRDIFSKQIEEVHIAGHEAFEQAKKFTKQLNPRLSKNIKEHTAEQGVSLFDSFGLEVELQQLIDKEVVMPSGGVLVIEQTEALVSIDINSSKAIGERNIEETALKINLEAAEEIARQLRLRDLAGLIVIDFIDMERKSNQQKIERQLKQSLKNDKARLHVGRISSFGLLEMSRQRLGPSILEKTTHICPRCHGRGLILTNEASGLALIRALRHYLLAQQNHNSNESSNDVTSVESALKTLRIECLPAIGQSVMNEHLHQIAALEVEFGLKIQFVFNVDLQELYGWRLDTERAGSARRDKHKRRGEHSGRKLGQERAGEKSGETKTSERNNKERGEKGRKRRQRGTEDVAPQHNAHDTVQDAEDSVMGASKAAPLEDHTPQQDSASQTATSRGRTRRRRKKGEQEATDVMASAVETIAADNSANEVVEPSDSTGDEQTAEKKSRRRFGASHRSKNAEAGEDTTVEAIPEAIIQASDEEKKSPPASKRSGSRTNSSRSRKAATIASEDRTSMSKAEKLSGTSAAKVATTQAEITEPASASEIVRGKPNPSVSEEIKPKRRGWWNNLIS